MQLSIRECRSEMLCYRSPTRSFVSADRSLTQCSVRRPGARTSKLVMWILSRLRISTEWSADIVFSIFCLRFVIVLWYEMGQAFGTNSHNGERHIARKEIGECTCIHGRYSPAFTCSGVRLSWYLKSIYENNLWLVYIELIKVNN